MDQKYDGAGALQAIAAREGMEAAEIRREIEKALHAAMQSNDPAARELWHRIAPDGRVPPVEELIGYIAAQLDKL